ncbi:MAG: single-stranded DNA binding protein [Halodesulfurarchaeum sp.]
MGDIEEIYSDLETDEVSLEEFRDAVEEKVEQMGGLADEETAAMLIAHELEDGQVNGLADVEPGMNEVSVTAKVTGIGELRTFERDEEDEPEGKVINVEVADETGQIRVSFWDEMAEGADEDLEVGQVLKIKGRPRDGYNGVELTADRVEVDEDTEIDVQVQDEYRVSDLTLGVSDVTLVGEVLGTDQVRTFDRDDGSEGRVSNLLVGDETGRVRVTLWDDRADLAETFDPHDVIEIVDGYVRERDGSLELHVGDRGDVNEVEADVGYVPTATPIDDVEIDETVDVAGVIRSADPVRTFDRDDGSEGKVRNVRLQDESGDIRIALWGEKAELEIGPGDEVLFVDVEIQEGWQDDLEASANWQSTVIPLEDGLAGEAIEETSDTDTGLDAFATDAGEDDEEDEEDDDASVSGSVPTVGEDGDYVEFTGVVVQSGGPVILDDGEKTVSVDTDVDVELGQECTVAGTLREGRLDAEEVR